MISANITNAQRKAVYRRDCFACALCDDRRTLQVHHVIPRGEGGTNHAMNLQQAITEYMADYYAPNWNPWAKSVHDGKDWEK